MSVRDFIDEMWKAMLEATGHVSDASIRPEYMRLPVRRLKALFATLCKSSVKAPDDPENLVYLIFSEIRVSIVIEMKERVHRCVAESSGSAEAVADFQIWAQRFIAATTDELEHAGAM